MRLPSNILVAFLYLLPALAVLVIWCVLLFTSTKGAPPGDMLTFVLTEDTNRLWFRWLLVVPALWVALSLAYLTPVATRPVGAVALLCLGVSLAAAAWLTLSSEVAIAASLPLVVGVRVARDVYRSRAGQ